MNNVKFYLKRTPQEPGATIDQWLSSVKNNPNTQHIYVNLDGWNFAWDPAICDFDIHEWVQQDFKSIENIHLIFACGKTVCDIDSRGLLPRFSKTTFEIWPAYASGKLIKNFKPTQSETLCDVVTEPLCHTKYYTLNTISSILNQRPFVITSAPGMNQTLKNWGFRLFDELFDYDLEPRRVSDISDATTWHHAFTAPLSTLTESDCSELRRLWQPKCRHNLQRLKQIALSDKYIPDIIKPELLSGYPGLDNYYETLCETRHLFKTHEAFKDI